jgi:ribonucleoside-diphosphate reductase beta chain
MATDSYFNLSSNPTNNYTFLPIYNAKYYEFYKKQLATFWIVSEVDLSKDRDDFLNKLSDSERHFVKNILAFFAASDGIVAENLDLMESGGKSLSCPNPQTIYTSRSA